MCCSMVYPEVEDAKRRLEKVVEYWMDLSAGHAERVGYNGDAYMEGRQTADSEVGLGFLMRKDRSFPPCFSYKGTKSLNDTLELYF